MAMVLRSKLANSMHCLANVARINEIGLIGPDYIFGIVHYVYVVDAGCSNE